MHEDERVDLGSKIGGFGGAAFGAIAGFSVGGLGGALLGAFFGGWAGLFVGIFIGTLWEDILYFLSAALLLLIAFAVISLLWNVGK